MNKFTVTAVSSRAYALLWRQPRVTLNQRKLSDLNSAMARESEKFNLQHSIKRIEAWQCGADIQLSAPTDFGSDDLLKLQTTGVCEIYDGSTHIATARVPTGSKKVVVRLDAAAQVDYQLDYGDEAFCGVSPNVTVAKLFTLLKTNDSLFMKIAEDAKP